jgi:hypothetical protein
LALLWFSVFIYLIFHVLPQQNDPSTGLQIAVIQGQMIHPQKISLASLIYLVEKCLREGRYFINIVLRYHLLMIKDGPRSDVNLTIPDTDQDW